MSKIINYKFLVSFNVDGSLQVVLTRCLERSLQQRTILDPFMDVGRCQMGWEQRNLTALQIIVLVRQFIL